MTRDQYEWTQKGIADDLRRRINDGQLPESERPEDALPIGMVVPTLDELMSWYGVARATAYGASRILARQGLIATSPRRQGIVAGLPTQTLQSDRFDRDSLRAEDGSYTFEREMVACGWAPRTVYHRVGFTDQLPGHVAQAYPNEQVVVERIRRRRAAPRDEGGSVVAGLERTITIFESHLPERVGRHVPEVATTERVGVGGCYALLADRGLAITRRLETIDIRPPTNEEAFEFVVPDLEFVVDMRRFCYTSDGRLICVDREVTLPQCVRWEYDVVQEP